MGNIYFETSLLEFTDKPNETSDKECFDLHLLQNEGR